MGHARPPPVLLLPLDDVPVMGDPLRPALTTASGTVYSARTVGLLTLGGPLLASALSSSPA